MAVALGGDCLADVAVGRAQPDVFGSVASDPTVSRLVARLAADVDAATEAIRAARAQARSRVWARRRPVPGPPGGQVIIDLDATLVTAHSDKELAAPTFKRGFGFHPILAFCDHGEDGSGETLAGMLRPGRPVRTPPRTTSPSSTPRSASSPMTNARGCWCAPTPVAGSSSSCTTSPTSGWSTPWGSTGCRRSLKHSTRQDAAAGVAGGDRR